MSKLLDKLAAQSLVEHDGELIFSKEKFAELLIRECVNTLDSKKDRTWQINYLGGWEAASEYIKQHFGVEE